MLNWKINGLTLTFRSTSTLGSTLTVLRVRYNITDLSDNTITSTATIQMVAISDNGTHIDCGDGETELSWDLIVANEAGTSLWFLFIHIADLTCQNVQLMCACYSSLVLLKIRMTSLIE